ncbi:MAG: O-antigen/teichoic acid export membrane protein [Flavobacteriales bacterium]|jgi:O-antigen/teichoic acid export membrane protein
MIKIIAGTVATRIVVMLISFAIVVMNTHHIGTEGQGTVALVSLGILLVVAFNNFLGGSAIVYLASRVPHGRLLAPCLLWTIFSVLIFIPIYRNMAIVPDEHINDVLILGGIQSLFTFQQQLLLGKRKVKEFNITLILQVTTLLGVLYFCYLMSGLRDSHAYINGLYASFTLTLILGIIFNFKTLHSISFKGMPKVFKEILKHSLYAQSSNVIQLLINRVTYVFLEQFTSRSSVGLFSVSMQLNEAALAPSKSMATVQFSELANSDNKLANTSLTINLLKVSLFITLLIGGTLALLPDALYTFIFGDDTVGIQPLIQSLFPGMLAMSMSSILAHHFSGTGRYHINTIGAVIALVTLISLGYLIIPESGILGATQCLSVTFGVQMLVLLSFFLIQDKPSLNEMLKPSISLDVFREFRN